MVEFLLSNLSYMWSSELRYSTVNDALMWEMIKLKIREQSLKYSSIKKAKMSRHEEELEKEINSLQRSIEANNTKGKDTEDAVNTLETKKSELEKIIEYRTKGIILRARCRWHNEGEKKHKIFSKSRETALQTRSNKPIKIGRRKCCHYR